MKYYDRVAMIIREEAKRVLRESASADMSVEDLYDKLRGMAPRDDMPVDDVAAEIGMDVEKLKAMLISDEFFNYMSDYDYSRPIGYDEDAKVVIFDDPYSN